VGLKAGQVVMTGSVMKTVFPTESATYRFDLQEIGFVEVHVAEENARRP
jgi:2-keto-4-pentenoate hydratase